MDDLIYEKIRSHLDKESAKRWIESPIWNEIIVPFLNQFKEAALDILIEMDPNYSDQFVEYIIRYREIAKTMDTLLKYPQRCIEEWEQRERRDKERFEEELLRNKRAYMRKR